jgi:hypothetical protein
MGVKEPWGSDVLFKNKIGLEFVVVEYFNAHQVKVRFSETGCVKTTAKKEIIKGEIKDDLHPSVKGVGFIGQGVYNSKHRAYRPWLSMLNRCYNEKEVIRKPTYKDKYVCDTWHNFQNFAPWFEVNYVEGWELDKDVLVKDNKIYSPETCTFLPTELNSVLIKFGGVIWVDRIGKYTVQCRRGAKTRYLGCFDSENDAFECYYIHKHNHIVDLCNKYKEHLTEPAIISLKGWVYGS